MKKRKTATKVAKKPIPKVVKKKTVAKARPLANIEMDKDRKAKPVGYRFKGIGVYTRPTAKEIAQGYGIVDGKKRLVYFENRPNRSDVNLRKKL